MHARRCTGPIARTILALGLAHVLGQGAPVAFRDAPRAARTQPAREDGVTFNKDIAPILYRRCLACHRPDGAAPFSLLTFDDAKRRAQLIAAATERRYMPPWKPTGDVEFVDARRLTDVEIDLIRRWVADGSPEGNSADRPAAPRLTLGWRLGEPDLVIRVPAYTLPPDGRDAFRNFVVAIPGGSSRYVRGLEFRPGSAAVHHANIRLDYTPASRRMDEGDPGPGYEGLILHSASYPDGYLLGWTPGQAAPFAPKGLAWTLEPGADFVVQLHMRPTGKPEQIAPSIGLYFTNDPPVRTPTMIRLGRQNIDIAPGDAAYKTTDSYTFPVDAEIQAIQPHSHYRARRVRTRATLPDGTVRDLIAIDDWDFAWQDVYRLAKPFWLPAGSRLDSEYAMDNSEANPRNPTSPPARALWGFKSSDEMADVWVQVLTRSDADRDTLVADVGRKTTAEDIVGYEMQLRVDPTNAPLRDDVAVLYLDLQRPNDAARHFAAVTALRPTSATARYNLGSALEAAARFAEASAAYRDAIRLDPQYASARVNLGNVLLHEGRIDEAVSQYHDALRIRPDDASAHNSLGRVLLVQGRIADAKAHITRALHAKPANPEAHFNLAQVLSAEGRARDAIASYRETLTLRPRWDAALVALSWLLSSDPDQSVHDPREALERAREAVDVTRGADPAALDALAAAHARAGQFEDAVSTASRAIALAVGAPADVLDAMRARLVLYRRHSAYRTPAR